MAPKVVLITGCSTGLGRDLAGRLSVSGYAVVATARNVATLADLNAALKLPLDVTSQESVDFAVSKTLERFGRIDVLVNNAGYAVRSAVEEIDEAMARKMFDVNVWGLLRVTQAVLPSMRAHRAGRIVYIGSVVGKFVWPVNGSYSASKYAVEALADASRLELRPFGISVVLVEPGAIKTQFMGTSESVGSRVTDNRTSPYAALYGEFHRLSAQPRSRGAEPGAVNRVVHRAIEARNPKARYLAAVSPAYRLLMKSGDKPRDFILRRAFRIS